MDERKQNEKEETELFAIADKTKRSWSDSSDDWED